ncbi:prefoldin subunit [Candidatus Woesearchaeota archaeon]|nr:prefoldin subunit [Candidatus Woesearchaeota archaeon]
MDISKETQEKIAQLQLFEQNLQSFMTQKRSFQSQLLEIENALKEVEGSQGAVYKIAGAVMFSAEKETLKKDLKERNDVLQLRIKNIDQQETALQEKAKKIQEEVMAEIDQHMKKDNERTD